MFKVIVKLAWSNAFLRFSRTFLLVILIALSMALMLSLQGIYDGMTLNMVDKTIRSDCGEVSIYQKGYRLNQVLSNNIKNADAILRKLDHDPNVKLAIKRFSVEGLSSTARKQSFANIIGIDLKQEERFGKFSLFLTKGKLSFENYGAIIGKGLADKLKVHIGSKVIFSTQNAKGEINALYLKVAGIIQTTNINIDNFAIYVPIKRVYDFLGVPHDEATQIAIRTDNEAFIKTLKKEYSNLDVESLLDLYPMLKQMEDIMAIFNSITFAIVMLVVFIGILGVMYVSILDRIREFGILRAIGMPYAYIRLQIFLEALFVGLIGYICGAILGYLSLKYLHIYGLDLSAYSAGLEKFGYSSIIYANIQASYFSSTFYAIISASLLSVLLPLRKIKNLNPIKVIKANT
ncbi:MAG: FtsX-like permease family protein [Sulfurospirillaceae bacterium]|nr:FtsX-like permease family protein [Sulfurospirillaceae bacterium]